MKLNQNIIEMEYAVRGEIPIRAAELRRKGKKTIPCNIGNPQALGQKSITFYRQVLSLLEFPERIRTERNRSEQSISDYVLDYAESFLENMETGMGAYTDSKGPLFIRESIAKYIDNRDANSPNGIIPANPEHIFLTDGASEGAKNILELLITDPKDGIMIPIPQYPLYSATIRRCGGTQVNYYPDEERDWALDKNELERAYNDAVKQGVQIKAIVVINPANPTGAILDRESVNHVIQFAGEKEIAIISDEVYQENLYGAEFISFASAVKGTDVPLFSLHSASKGFYGECGHRGGYMEARNLPKVLGNDLPFIDILFKQASVNLCSNTVGQSMMFMISNPPEPGSDPYQQHITEKQSVLDDLFEKAMMVKDAFKEMDGVECFGKIGAMYLFPRLNKLPEGTGDFEYCMNLLETTGLTTVNGSGFGQKPGTNHLRFAFLPQKEMLIKVLPEWIDFHNNYINR